MWRTPPRFGGQTDKPPSMKTLRLLLALALGATCSLTAQDPTADEPAAFPAVVFTPEQLDQLLAPIALYPDALIALILPAATFPTDIVLAARYLKENPGNLSQVEHRAWDDSVKSLTHYADVLKWLDENLTWTKQVGEAFAAQPADVMNSIQRLRARARASGALSSTPQQQVLAEPDVVRIVPADPDVIYVPRYDPAVVFVERPYFYPAPMLTFGAGWRVGSWLAYDFDWRRCTLWVGDRHRRWDRHDWHWPVVPISPPPHGHAHIRPPARVWQPSTRYHRPIGPSVPGYRSQPPPPATSSTLARTYGRTPAPAAPRADQRPPQNPAPTSAITGARWLHRPEQPSRVASETTVVAPPAPAPANVSNQTGRDWPRAGNRTRTSTVDSTPGSRIAPAAPTLSVVGPVSAVRPTVAPAPQSRSNSHLGHSASAAAHTYSRPTAAPRESTRSYSAPAPQPAHVAPPAPAPAPTEQAAQPPPARGGHDARSHTRRGEQP